jgi:hypothetical protein
MSAIKRKRSPRSASCKLTLSESPAARRRVWVSGQTTAAPVLALAVAKAITQAVNVLERGQAGGLAAFGDGVRAGTSDLTAKGAIGHPSDRDEGAGDEHQDQGRRTSHDGYLAPTRSTVCQRLVRVRYPERVMERSREPGFRREADRV